MSIVLVGMGANLGDPGWQLQQGLDQLARDGDLDVRAVSTWVSSPAVGGPSGQPEFLNRAVRLQTGLPPELLLQHLLKIERKLGRVRRGRWEARTLDLDILLYGSEIIQTRRLCVPHPWMAVRGFVIGPAAEIGGELVHPVIGIELRQIWARLQNRRGSVAILDGSQPALTAAGWPTFDRRAGWHCVPAPTAAAPVEWVWTGSDGAVIPFARPPLWLLEASSSPSSADGSIRGYIVIAPPALSPLESDSAVLRNIVSRCPAPAVLIRPPSPAQKIELVQAALDGMSAIPSPRMSHDG